MRLLMVIALVGFGRPIGVRLLRGTMYCGRNNDDIWRGWRWDNTFSMNLPPFWLKAGGRLIFPANFADGLL